MPFGIDWQFLLALLGAILLIAGVCGLTKAIKESSDCVGIAILMTAMQHEEGAK